MSTNFKVRLNAANITNVQERRFQTVSFDVSPDLNEQRTVTYDSVDPTHAPGQFMIYKKTAARRFQLTQVRLISRTRREASLNLAILWILRGWTMPNFGTETGGARNNPDIKKDNSPYNSDKLRQIIDSVNGRNRAKSFLGAPPAVLELSAYSRFGANDGIHSLGHIRRVPVVIESLGIFYPSDVDYVPTEDEFPTPMPTVMNIDISLTEAQSPLDMARFSLDQYRRGELTGY